MESPRKLDGRHTTANDRIQRMRDSWTNRRNDDGSNYLLCKTDVSHVISGNVKRLESFRQRRSARYALEWLDRIRPESRDFKLDSADRGKIFGDHFVRRKPVEQSASKAYTGVQNFSVKSFGKYRENLRESRKMRSAINDSFLRCWHPVQQEIDIARVPEESRDLVPSKNGKIFRYQEEHIELLSVDEMVISDKPHSGSEHKRSNMELCHPFFQPFLNEKRNLRNGQNSIRVDELSGEAVVIYRRNGHKRIDDWKNYQIEQFAFGKAKFGLMLDAETREKSSARQARVTRRRRSKFRYEPMKIGGSVSIEFKKFDEIREMFHPDNSSPIFRCGKSDNTYFWKSNEFRLRSSAEKKLNLFKEMKKSEKYRRKKFRETVARSLNYRCSIAESFSSQTLTIEDGEGKKENVIAEGVEDIEIPRAPSPGKAKGEEYFSGEVISGDNSLKRETPTECPNTPGDIPKSFPLNNLRDIWDELVENEEVGESEGDDAKRVERSDFSSANPAVMEVLKKDDGDATELEELILRLQTALRDCHKVLGLCNSEAAEEGRTALEEEFSNEAVPCNYTPIIAYPVSTAKSGQSGRGSSKREAGIGRMKKLKNYDFDDNKDMFLRNKVSSLSSRDQAYLDQFIGGATESFSHRSHVSDVVTSLSESSVGVTVPENKSVKSGKFAKTEKSVNSEKSWKSEKSPASKISAISRKSSVKLPRRSFIDSLAENKDNSNWESTKVVEKRILKLECRLKELLRRIGVYPTKEQDAIKRCLERLKETSEAVLKRLRVNCLDGCKCTPGCQGDRAGDIIQRGYHSEPESTIKMNRDQKSIILKTSGSEIQLNVGMEITMENFDPVTGEKLRPEENRDFEQQGNIQCKLVKPGEKPVTFINTDFLYNPKTGASCVQGSVKFVDRRAPEQAFHLKEIPQLAKLFSYTWTFGYFVCKMVYYMQSLSAICSVLTLTAMSVERYYAIVHPMRAQYICTISQARKIITFTWIASIFLAIPVLFAQIHMPVGVRVKGFWCVRDYDNPTIWRVHETYMLLLILVIPTSVMGVAYVTICLEIWQVMQRRQDLTSAKILHNRYNKTSVNSDNFCMYGKEKNNHRKAPGEQTGDEAHVKQVIKMLVAVVVIYVVCWSPLLVDNVLQAYGVLPFMKFGRLKYLSTAFHLMAYFNSCINPIIYGFMSKNFRDSFRKALCCHRRKGHTSARYPSMSNDRSTSIRYAESSPAIYRYNNQDEEAHNPSTLLGYKICTGAA